jgi:hypothetical protein
MNPIDINELKAQDTALDQEINNVHAYIASELRSFLVKAQGMGRRTEMMKFVSPGSGLRKPVTLEKPCYRLALAYSIDQEHGGLDHCASIVVIGTDGTFCFANNKLQSTPCERIIASPEAFASHLMEFFREFRDMESAQKVIGFALRGMPMELGCPLWFKLSAVRGGDGFVPDIRGSSAQSPVLPKVLAVIAAIIILFCIYRAVTHDKTPPPEQPVLTGDGATLPTGDPPGTITGPWW